MKIYYFVLIRKIGRIKNRLILTGIFIELGVIEIEYELNKINVFTKIDEEPTLLRNTQFGIGNPILVGKKGNICFNGEEKLSTVESVGGIWCSDGQSLKNYNINSGMSKYFVCFMLEDKNENIWIGTRNTGLYQFDGKSFTNFSE